MRNSTAAILVLLVLFSAVSAYRFVAAGIVDTLFVPLAVLGFLLLVLRRILRNVRLTSELALGMIVGMTFFGVGAVSFVIGEYKLSTTDSLGVLTVAAEALGFIGLSLVEVSTFLRGKEDAARIKPKLTFEYDPQGNHDEFTPEIPFYSPSPTDERVLISASTRRFLRVRVKNEGEGIATNCRGTVRYIESRSGCQGPSRERKPLRWELGEMRQTIPPRVGAEILIVALSDSHSNTVHGVRCGLVEEGRPAPAAMHTFLAHPDNIVNFNSRVSDGFCYGDFVIEITVICDEGVQESSRFLLHARTEGSAVSMEKMG